LGDGGGGDSEGQVFGADAGQERTQADRSGRRELVDGLHPFGQGRIGARLGAGLPLFDGHADELDHLRLNSGLNDRRRRLVIAFDIDIRTSFPGPTPLMVDVRQTGGGPDPSANPNVN
jgi:hypothetical protein